MGRKKRSEDKPTANKSVSNHNHDKEKSVAFNKKQKREIKILTDQLLEKCTQMPSATEEWDNYVAIYGLLTELREVQKSLYSQIYPAVGLFRQPREDKFSTFLQWIQENGVSLDSVEIAEFTHVGYGLKCKHDMKEDEPFVTIPRKLMMTTQLTGTSALGDLMQEDRLLQAMPNVCLALFLLSEAHNVASFWKPYIDTLPASYSTVLYYTPEELQLLKGSPVFSDALNQCRSIARQYAYFYNLFQRSPLAKTISMKDTFTYEDYRWAVSTVMTRQNPIPTEDGTVGFGLIPLWDMCNHQDGPVKSVYDTDTQCGQGYTMTHLKTGDQIFMCYGSRSSGDFFLHNGFIPSQCPHDSTTIRLGVSKNDPLHMEKMKILSLLGLNKTSSYKLHGWGSNIDADLLAFLQIFVANKELLEKLLLDETLRSNLREDSMISEDDAALNFLSMRVKLLLKVYPNTDEVPSKNLSANAEQARKLLEREKAVLTYTLTLLPENYRR